MSTHGPRGRRRRPRRARVSRRALAGALGLLLVCAVAATVLLVVDSRDAPSSSTADPTPTLASPQDPRISETASTMLRVDWEPVAASDYYEVTVQQGATTQSMRSEGTEVQVPRLDAATDYIVRVRAVDERSGSTTLRSHASTSTLGRTAEGDRPALLVPAEAGLDEADNRSMTFTWDAITSATGYVLQVDTDDDFTDPEVVRTDSTSTTIKGLDAVSDYVARVRATGPDKTRSAWTKPMKVSTVEPKKPVPLDIASFNITCHSCDGRSWLARRGAVAQTIASRDLDVVGLQEAQQSHPKGVGTSQFTDLVRQLGARGQDFRVTDGRIAASKGTRIIYRPSELTLLKAGAVKYTRQTKGSGPRYYSWAVLRQRASGKELFFVSTHLEPRSSSVRLTQARQLARDAKRLRGSRPAVVLGDLNASQYHLYKTHRALTAAGFVDPIGVQASSRQPRSDATAEKRIHVNYDSYNGFHARPSVGTSNPSLNGVYLDYIFTTPMRVLEFENVVDLRSNGSFGLRPSDHDMLRARVLLP